MVRSGRPFRETCQPNDLKINSRVRGTLGTIIKSSFLTKIICHGLKGQCACIRLDSLLLYSVMMKNYWLYLSGTMQVTTRIESIYKCLFITHCGSTHNRRTDLGNVELTEILCHLHGMIPSMWSFTNVWTTIPNHIKSTYYFQ